MASLCSASSVDTLAIVQPVLLVAACYSVCSSVCTHSLLAVACDTFVQKCVYNMQEQCGTHWKLSGLYEYVDTCQTICKSTVLAMVRSRTSHAHYDSTHHAWLTLYLL